jgi:O-antigen/teichoic acid export membrane protein
MSVTKPALPVVPLHPNEAKAASLGTPVRTGWRSTVANLRFESAHSSRLVSGSLVMLVGSGVVSAMNFGYNVIIARLLGPADFGHTTAVGTLLMLASALTLSFQLVCAKFVARNDSLAGKAEVYRNLRRRAWLVGIALGTALLALSAPVSSYLRLPSPWLIVLLAAGITFYVPLGVKRGGLQGTYAFGRLSFNYIVEVAVKLLGTWLLVEGGWGVTGAVAALALSVILCYFVPIRDGLLEPEPAGSIPASFGEGMQAIVFFIGQVLINNVDILMVKHLFHPQDAGLYAAASLVGRVVYLASWSVISTMFPFSAGQRARAKYPAFLVMPLLLVLFINIAFILVMQFVPELVLRTVFGAAFASVAPLLVLYAAATSVYSLSVVLIAFEMSQRIANTAWLQLVFAGLVITGITLFHASLHEVIVVQLVVRVGLLIAVTLPFFRSQHALTELQEAA